MTQLPAYLTRASLASALEIGESTVDEMVRRGVLPRPVHLGAELRWRWKDVVSLRLLQLRRQNDVVYFLECGEFIKIGFSSNFAGRLKSLKGSNPHEIKVLHTEYGTLAWEAELLARFSKCRTHGEWFTKDPTLLAFIESRKASK